MYGRGKQVRDLLAVEDLVDCYLRAVERIDRVKGMTFNIGGGVENALSILEFLELLGDLSKRKVQYQGAEWRPGDQPLYISDNRRAARLLGWRPQVAVKEGMQKLRRWVVKNRSVLAQAASRL